jgi:hypothetical protein
MTRMIALLATAAVLIAGVPCRAQANADLAQENTQLRQRVDTLEKQVQELKTAVELVPSQVKGPAKTPPEQVPPAPAPTGPEKKPFWSTLDVQFYGYIKADAAYDTSQGYPGDYVVWVNSEATNDDDDEFDLTANETRLGFNFTGPKTATMETSGKVEFDFYGNYAEENKAKIQMRHAYAQVYWPGSRFAILGGQTWDVISPLTPSTLNYTVLWDAGNIGYRRPQLRLTKGFELADQTILQVQGAIVRTIGSNLLVVPRSGEDAGFPTLESRVGLTIPLLPAGPTRAGVSGHWGREEYDLDTYGRHEDVDSWSINLDLTQPVAQKVLFKAELFTGQDLATYFGGIGQGATLTTVHVGNTDIVTDAKAISAHGGWFTFTFGPWDKWTFNTGLGIDQVDRDDVVTGARTSNRSIFGNTLYALNENITVGVELTCWRTEYRGPGDADDLRVQGSLIYRF